MSYKKLKELILSRGYLSSGLIGIFLLIVFICIYTLSVFLTKSGGAAALAAVLWILPVSILFTFFNVDMYTEVFSIAIFHYVAIIFWCSFAFLMGNIIYKLYEIYKK